MTEPTPAAARRNRRVLLVFLGIFVASAVGTTIYGFRVVSRIKDSAVRSDAALRARAWSILAAADELGRFPVTQEEADAALDRAALSDRLAGRDPAVESGSASIELEGTAFPADRSAALPPPFAAQEPSLEDLAEIVVVSWPPEGALPPVLSVGGRPSGLVQGGTTIELTNVWLRRASERLAR